MQLKVPKIQEPLGRNSIDSDHNTLARKNKNDYFLLLRSDLYWLSKDTPAQSST
jgi:hypothetical protein